MMTTDSLELSLATVGGDNSGGDGQQLKIHHQRQQQQAEFITIRNPPWYYMKLQLLSNPPPPPPSKSQPLDPITTRAHLTSSLQQFLGLTGTAIPIDILKTSSSSEEEEGSSSSQEEKIIWIRVPREDGQAVRTAIAQWMGGKMSNRNIAWRILGGGDWLNGISGGDGMELFDV